MKTRISQSRDFLDQLQGPSTSLPDFVPPCPINAQLRPYQQAGLNWLAFLRRFNLHGALCDDMGLGKTLQTLAIIASDHFERANGRETEPRQDGSQRQPQIRSLIVCPSSLSGHWEAEARQYCPTLGEPFMYVGSAAERRCLVDGRLNEAALVITSYDIVRSDVDVLAALDWNYCVLDEGHLIKNPKTKLAGAIKSLRAQHRLLLSGTPIQNNLLELWSLFDFLLPGYLGTEREFSDRYAKPILALQHQQAASSAGTTAAANASAADSANPASNGGSSSAAIGKWTQRDFDEAESRLATLHKQILPFILRRMKEDVLKDLPPKIIQDYTCKMSTVQRIIYDDLLRSAALRSEISTYIQSRLRDDKTEAGGTKGGANEQQGERGGQMHVFQALQYLRRLCIHPSLVLTRDHPLAPQIDDEMTRNGWKMTDLAVAPKFQMLRYVRVMCSCGRC